MERFSQMWVDGNSGDIASTGRERKKDWENRAYLHVDALLLATLVPKTYEK